MARQLEEIRLTFVTERVRFNNGTLSDGPTTAIIECREQGNQDSVIVKVESLPTDFAPHLDYLFYGHWDNHPKYGKQFAAKTFVKVQPLGRRGVIHYLMQAPHVGNITAGKLWRLYGDDTIEMLRKSPDECSLAIGGAFTVERARTAAEYLHGECLLQNVSVEMMDVLAGYGFPKETAKKAIEKWGNHAPRFIRQNPFLLMRFRGCGFLRCDQLYLNLGHNPAKMKRQALCAWFVVARDSSGSTWHDTALVETGLREKIAGVAVQPVKAVKLALRAGLLASHRDRDGKLWLAESRKAKAEDDVADRIRQWLSMGEDHEWPWIRDLAVSEHQVERLEQALQSRIGFFTGGPGTGKTFSAAKVIERIVANHSPGQVAVACPTGKAAVRITAVMSGYGLDLRARTIHSLLEVRAVDEGEGWGFVHNEGNPLPQKFIIVDEASMLDIQLAASLFRACRHDTHLLLVGDTGQLPPVGHGAPLRDMIAAGVPCGELTEIWRNSGRIVRSCHQMRAGERFQVSPRIDLPHGENLKMIHAKSEKLAVLKTIEAIKKLAEKKLVDPVWGCQVIVAVNKNSHASRATVNRLLQDELNRDGARAEGNPFRVADKIICLKNGFYPTIDNAPPPFNAGEQDGKVFIANGEQAEVKKVEPRLTYAQLDAPPRLVKIPMGKGDGEEGEGGNESGGNGKGFNWDLAYAVSCHKGQGSQWPVVFILLDDSFGARMVCGREWIYTAASRAETACFLVGKLEVAYGMLARESIRKRKTFLVEKVSGGLEFEDL